MKLWLIRAGSNGEFEQKFLDEGRVYVTWNELDTDLSQLTDRKALIEALKTNDPNAKPGKLRNHASQVWPFAHTMQKGDWVVLPSKSQPVIHIGKLVGDYQFHADGPNPFFHSRAIDWFAKDIPRSNFAQDLLYSFGAFMTICRIQRNHAAERIEAMSKNNWLPESNEAILKASNLGVDSLDSQMEDASDEVQSEVDLESIAKQQVIRLIETRFKGHDLTRLITAILKAQGYTTWQSPAGADGGVDILASNGSMGFGNQSICVEVKSGTGLIDRPTVDKLLGVMTKFNSEYGLFVAWGGFKSNVQKELASSFYKLRLWTQDDVIEQLFSCYADLDEEIKAELPLKSVWMVALADE